MLLKQPNQRFKENLSQANTNVFVCAMNNVREIDIIEGNKIANAVLVLLEKVPGAAFTSKRALINDIGFDGAVVSNEDYVILNAEVLA